MAVVRLGQPGLEVRDLLARAPVGEDFTKKA